MLELLQPYLTDITLSLISLLTALIITGLVALRKKIFTWINNVNSKEQQHLLQFVANQVFSLVEMSMQHETSQKKINTAIEYACEILEKYGINVSLKEVRSAIESEVLKHNKEIGKI